MEDALYGSCILALKTRGSYLRRKGNEGVDECTSTIARLCVYGMWMAGDYGKLAYLAKCMKAELEVDVTVRIATMSM